MEGDGTQASNKSHNFHINSENKKTRREQVAKTKAEAVVGLPTAIVFVDPCESQTKPQERHQQKQKQWHSVIYAAEQVSCSIIFTYQQ